MNLPKKIGEASQKADGVHNQQGAVIFMSSNRFGVQQSINKQSYV